MTRYTLDGPAQTGPTSPLVNSPTVIAISRVTVSIYLDTQDIVVRRGNVLEPSHTGRWATRLSLGVTELIVGRLALTRPGALVTDQPQSTTPAYRLLVDVSRFDLAADDETATVEANWQIISRDVATPVRRARARIDVSQAGADEVFERGLQAEPLIAAYRARLGASGGIVAAEPVVSDQFGVAMTAGFTDTRGCRESLLLSEPG